METLMDYDDYRLNKPKKPLQFRPTSNSGFERHTPNAASCCLGRGTGDRRDSQTRNHGRSRKDNYSDTGRAV